MMTRFRPAGLAALLVAVLCTAKPAGAVPSWGDQIKALVVRGGVLAVSEKGETLFALNPSTPFIPASTTKVATANAAIDLLGLDYRFPTDFYYDKAKKTLWMKGYGDPMLVSEELAAIAEALRAQGLSEVGDLALDESFFSPNIKVAGASRSLNPYDALNGALIANFNTIYVNKQKNGEITSAEPQTPMTELTRILAARAPYGKQRVSLTATPDQSLLYVGHLLKAFLVQEGVAVNGTIAPGTVPAGLSPFYHHLSSKALPDILEGLLKYSNNFIANQLYLHMGAKLGNPPASLAQSNHLMRQYLSRLGLPRIEIEEGSGLSRTNAITPHEMVALLKHFAPHRALMHEEKGRFSKTGTLTGVSCLVGYFPSSHHGWVRFAILLNQGGNHRERIADLLQKGLGI